MIADSSKTCLVTGALGFLGKYVVSEFSLHGYRVCGIGREALLGGVSGLSEYRNMELPSPDLGELVHSLQPRVIVHTAGPASVSASMADPAADFAGTVEVLLGLLETVRLTSPHSRVVIVSSAAVYGNPASLPVAEAAELEPVSPYGYDKQIAETLLAGYARVHGLNTCAARVFSAYGPGLRRQILWDVCEKASSCRPVQLFGTGKETRDFIHAADVALALRTLAEDAPMCGESFNVASGVATSIREIADALIQEIAPGTTAQFSGESRPGDPLGWQADISRIGALGFAPTVHLARGLADYAAWYLDQRRDQ